MLLMIAVVLVIAVVLMTSIVSGNSGVRQQDQPGPKRCSQHQHGDRLDRAHFILLFISQSQTLRLRYGRSLRPLFSMKPELNRTHVPLSADPRKKIQSGEWPALIAAGERRAQARCKETR